MNRNVSSQEPCDIWMDLGRNSEEGLGQPQGAVHYVGWAFGLHKGTRQGPCPWGHPSHGEPQPVGSASPWGTCCVEESSGESSRSPKVSGPRKMPAPGSQGVTRKGGLTSQSPQFIILLLDCYSREKRCETSWPGHI